MPAADLARQIQEHPEKEEYSLTDIPAERKDISAVDFQASLQEAASILDDNDAEALFVTRHTIPGISRVYGVLTREDIDRSYRVN
jgi:CIC family chloride channel protein